MLKIKKIQTDNPVSVYDITVDGTHSFFANNVLVHNCEINLPTKPLSHFHDGASRKRIRVPKDKYNDFLEYKSKNNGILYLNKEKFNGSMIEAVSATDLSMYKLRKLKEAK